MSAEMPVGTTVVKRGSPKAGVWEVNEQPLGWRLYLDLINASGVSHQPLHSLELNLRKMSELCAKTSGVHRCSVQSSGLSEQY